MTRRLYVGNIPDDVRADDLLALFSRAGVVSSAEVVRDPDTNRATGFAYVEMATDEWADNAVRMFDGYMMDGQEIEVAPVMEYHRGHD